MPLPAAMDRTLGGGERRRTCVVKITLRGNVFDASGDVADVFQLFDKWLAAVSTSPTIDEAAITAKVTDAVEQLRKNQATLGTAVAEHQIPKQP